MCPQAKESESISSKIFFSVVFSCQIAQCLALAWLTYPGHSAVWVVLLLLRQLQSCSFLDGTMLRSGKQTSLVLHTRTHLSVAQRFPYLKTKGLFFCFSNTVDEKQKCFCVTGLLSSGSRDIELHNSYISLTQIIWYGAFPAPSITSHYCKTICFFSDSTIVEEIEEIWEIRALKIWIERFM